MILSSSDIKKALEDKTLIIDPIPNDEHIDTSAVDLRIGNKFYQWKPDLVNQTGVDVTVDIDHFDFKKLADLYLEEVPKLPSGKFTIEPEKFYLSSTFETIQFPTESQLAGRVEGKSSLARLGLVIHMTAPTIHCGFGGVITLEIFNYGPFPIVVTPEKTRICQLIIEMLSSKPPERTGKTFMDQKNPKG